MNGPAEKWRRLNSPQCHDDYGLSLSEAELRTFPAGRAILAEVLRLRRQSKQMSLVATRLGAAAGKTMEEILVKVLKAHPEKPCQP
jgi:hypothetical protein